MSEAPERIWAFYTPDDFDDTATITAYEMVQHGGQEYRRADLPPTLSAAMELPEVRALVETMAGLKRIVEEIDGAMNHGTWRDEKGMRLKDTPEWVSAYAALAVIKELKI